LQNSFRLGFARLEKMNGFYERPRHSVQNYLIFPDRFLPDDQ
jgi:hypothetical protein